ncbi:dihydroneopterin aldolase [Sulfurimonas sp.]|uniref:dihydroneopterin aldolase n=1 Tax=Sulfurimonas sp. TaxID=2022749 RepID=UPI002B482D7A|nr:dihydroneopterin aldolase [Sulfurimonas sp.]
MTISIEDLKFKCILGILDFERITPQDIIINLKIKYKSKKNFINYAKIVEITKDFMIKSEFLLIEDAIKELNLKLIKEFKPIKKLKIKIAKPSILPQCIVSVRNTYKYKS